MHLRGGDKNLLSVNKKNIWFDHTHDYRGLRLAVTHLVLCYRSLEMKSCRYYSNKPKQTQIQSSQQRSYYWTATGLRINNFRGIWVTHQSVSIITQHFADPVRLIIACKVSRGGTAYSNRGIRAMQGHRLHWGTSCKGLLVLLWGRLSLNTDYDIPVYLHTHKHTYIHRKTHTSTFIRCYHSQ